MKGKHCIFLLLILGALLACNDPKPVTDTLHRAEALMSEYPDTYNNGRQWKRICKTSGNSEGIGNFFLFL